MKNLKIFFLAFIIIILNVRTKLFSQNSEDILLLKKEIKTSQNQYKYSFNAVNEYQLVLNNMFVFYKKVFSANDIQSCSFYPSCSQYAMQTIKINGFMIGILDTFDRLSRCNGMSPQNYTKYKNTNLLYDLVK